MDLSRVITVNHDYRGVAGQSVNNRRMMADVVVIDQTNPQITKPLLYLLREETAAILEHGGLIDAKMMNKEHQPFVLMGEILEINRKTKVITLINDNTISYKHLIIATGASSHQQCHEVDNTDSFSPGVFTLAEAIKMRREGLKPGNGQEQAAESKLKGTNTASLNGKKREKGGKLPTAQVPHCGTSQHSSAALGDMIRHLSECLTVDTAVGGNQGNPERLYRRARLFEVHL